jgi:hypothetical protein
MAEKGAEADSSLEALKEQLEGSVKRVDIKRVYNALLDVVNEGIVSDKLNEVIKYLEEFI